MKYLTALALLLVSCNPPSPSPQVPVNDPTYCEPACQHLADLRCPEGEPVYNSDIPGPEGVPNQTCTDWCKEMQDRQASLNPQCLLLITSCDQVEEYRAKDPATCGSGGSAGQAGADDKTGTAGAAQ